MKRLTLRHALKPVELKRTNVRHDARHDACVTADLNIAECKMLMQHLYNRRNTACIQMMMTPEELGKFAKTKDEYLAIIETCKGTIKYLENHIRELNQKNLIPEKTNIVSQ